MALVDFPRVSPETIGVQLNTPGLGVLRSPYSQGSVQVISRGVAFWTGTISWSIRLAALGGEEAADELIAFITSLEGGLQAFDIPMMELQRDKPVRFYAKDESDNDNSVQVTAISPSSSTASRIGYASDLTLDTAATTPSGGNPAVGLRKADWVSLHNADMTRYFGTYQCTSHQAAAQVTVSPAPPVLRAGASYRLIAREPVMRARLTGGSPVVNRRTQWLEPINLSWIQEFV